MLGNNLCFVALAQSISDLSAVLLSWLPTQLPESSRPGVRSVLQDTFLKICYTANVDSSETQRCNAYAREVWQQINARRHARGLHGLVWREDLCRIAREHSEDMIRRRFFAHACPDGKDVAMRLQAHSVGFTLCGENLAMNNHPRTVKIAVAGWMWSRGHRENILTPSFSATGVGCAISGRGECYFTQVFLAT